MSDSAAVILNPQSFAAELKASVEIIVARELAKIPGMLVEKPLSIKEAADFLQIHPITLSKYMKRGVIKPHKVGKYPRFFASELNAQIKAKKP